MIRHPVYGVLALAALGGAAWLPVLRHAPNRLLSGQPLDLGALGGWGAAVVVPPLLLLLSGFLVRARLAAWVALVAAASGLILLPLAAGLAAAAHVGPAAPQARVSIGAGGWLIVALGFLALIEAARRLALPPAARLGLGAVLAAGLAVPAALGLFDALAIVKEWQAKRDIFGDALVRHCVLVGGTLLPTLALGLPLGVLAHRRPRVRGPLLSGLSLIQTIPSLALFGLLMAPLTALGEALPWVRALGIRGIGPAPAILALTLYALLPVVRNTVAGLAAVPAALLDAARGQGMTRGQIFRWVEVPLAAPVLLAGVRVTLVQTVGLAAVAALIGAGGLGALMFQGLFANAVDLILLGALPVVALAVAADLGFRLLAEIAGRRRA